MLIRILLKQKKIKWNELWKKEETLKAVSNQQGILYVGLNQPANVLPAMTLGAVMAPQNSQVSAEAHHSGLPSAEGQI